VARRAAYREPLRRPHRPPRPTASRGAARQETAVHELPSDGHTPASTASAVATARGQQLTSCHSTLNHIAMILKDKGNLVVVTNIIDNTSTEVETFIEDTSRIMKLVLQVKGKQTPVSNYVWTQGDYTKALQQLYVNIELYEKYETKILSLEKEHHRIVLSHLVIMGKKYDKYNLVIGYERYGSA
jgi:hypothetical protein